MIFGNYKRFGFIINYLLCYNEIQRVEVLVMKKKIILTGIIRCKDEYLVVQRSAYDDVLPGSWEFPGGNIEDGELLLDALKRELKEEVNYDLDIKKAKLINVFDEIKEKKETYHYIEFDYLIEEKSKEINIKLSNEHDDYKWVKKDSDLLDDFIKNKIKDL